MFPFDDVIMAYICSFVYEYSLIGLKRAVRDCLIRPFARMNKCPNHYEKLIWELMMNLISVLLKRNSICQNEIIWTKYQWNRQHIHTYWSLGKVHQGGKIDNSCILIRFMFFYVIWRMFCKVVSLNLPRIDRSQDLQWSMMCLGTYHPNETFNCPKNPVDTVVLFCVWRVA